MKWVIHGIVAAIIVALIVWYVAKNSTTQNDGAWPTQPIQVVVPYSAGGGTDSFVRLLARAVVEDKLLPQPLVVINQPGGSGTIGSRFVKDARADGYRLLCHHESLITAELAGTVNFGPADFKPIAQTGGIELLVVVREDSEYQSVRDLLNAANSAPGTIRFGANQGSPAHFTAMQLETAVPGARFNLITSGGGQKRYVSLIGGHLDAGIFSLSEYLSFLSPEGTPPEKNIRALAILSPKRHKSLGDVPTCIDDNLQVTSQNAYYWFAPEETPTEVVDKMREVLRIAMADKDVAASLAEWSISAEFKDGESLENHLKQRVAALTPLAVRGQTELPNFPLYLMCAVVLLSIVCVLEARRSKPSVENADASESKSSFSLQSLAVSVVLIGYVVLLQFPFVPFAILTTAMVFAVGLSIARPIRSHLAVLVEVALLAGFGSEFIFTEIFTVALP